MVEFIYMPSVAMGADGQCLEGERVGEKRLERVETRVGHHKDKATGESKSPDTACHVAFKIVDFAHSSCHPHAICTVPSMIRTHHTLSQSRLSPLSK